ncbi:MAG TPA: 2-alkenal reductase, partial [Telluria sp.]|nr:2-alkenal reductase [Telluria sp.]
MKRYWLIFAQTVTIALAVYFVVAALRPEWLGRQVAQVQVGTGPRSVPVLQSGPLPISGTYRDAAGRAMPAVVNILTSKALRQSHPLLKDP